MGSEDRGGPPNRFSGVVRRADAFSGDGAASAGELRAYRDDDTWFVEGDTGGDGSADLVIAVILPPSCEMRFGDFLA